MFSKLALFVASTLAIAAVATPAPFADTYKCNTGNVQCCNSAEFVNNDNRAAMVTLLGAFAQGVTGKIHTQCTSVTGIGAGQASTWYVVFLNQRPSTITTYVPLLANRHLFVVRRTKPVSRQIC